MEYIDYTVTKDDEGKGIDRILKKILTSKEINVYEIIRKKLCKINSTKCNETFRVKENDIISIAGFIVEKNKESESEADKTDNFGNYAGSLMKPNLAQCSNHEKQHLNRQQEHEH